MCWLSFSGLVLRNYQRSSGSHPVRFDGREQVYISDFLQIKEQKQTISGLSDGRIILWMTLDFVGRVSGIPLKNGHAGAVYCLHYVPGHDRTDGISLFLSGGLVVRS